jgi:hypothetical protein
MARGIVTFLDAKIELRPCNNHTVLTKCGTIIYLYEPEVLEFEVVHLIRWIKPTQYGHSFTEQPAQHVLSKLSHCLHNAVGRRLSQMVRLQRACSAHPHGI